MGSISWEKLYEAQTPKLLGLCRRYLQDMSLAEDIVHDAFVTAMQKENSYKADGPIEAWLRKITVNTVLMHLRKEKRLLELAQEDEAGTSNDEEDLPETDMEQLLAQGFDRFELIMALDNLPEHHRVVFNLYVMENYTHKQIAEVLGISPGTSKSHLARARKKLQGLLLKKKNVMQKKERRAVLLLFPFFKKETRHPLDNLYRKTFSDFELPPSGKIPTRLAANLKKPLPLPTTVGIAIKVGLGVMVVAGVSALWWLRVPQNPITVTQTKVETPFPTAHSTTAPLDSLTINDTQISKAAPKPLSVAPSNTAGPASMASSHLTGAGPFPSVPSARPVVIRRQVVQKDTVFQRKQSNQQ